MSYDNVILIERRLANGMSKGAFGHVEYGKGSLTRGIFLYIL